MIACFDEINTNEEKGVHRRGSSRFARDIGGLFGVRPDLEVCGTASNAEIALTEIPTLDPDIALIDVSMPGIDGIELVRRLRQLPLHVGIIMLSGHVDTRYREAALQAGAQAYVPKGNFPALVKALGDVVKNERSTSVIGCDDP